MAGVWLSADAVPDPSHGGNDPGFSESFAQCRDGDAYGVGERVGVLIPCPFQKLFGADHAAFGGDEEVENGELLTAARAVAAVHGALETVRLQHDTGELSH